MRSLAVLRIGSKVVSSSGLDSSPLVVGLAASLRWVGHGMFAQSDLDGNGGLLLNLSKVL